MSLTVLRASVDTLEVSLEGDLAEGVAEKLDELKLAAQDFELSQRFGDTRLFVEPKAFGLWRWRLTCPDFAVVLSPPSLKPGHRPDGQIRFSAFGLSTREHEELVDEAFGVLKELGDYYERNVARLDVCADLQGWTPTYEEMQGICCPAVYRGLHLAGRDVQTFQYGKGELAVRVYDKTAELGHSGKAWMREVWSDCVGYRHGEAVTRVEAQLKSKPLRELGITSTGAAIARAGDVLEWVLREWCQLRVPTGDQKVTRWPEHEVWTQLRAAVVGSKRCERARKKAKLLSMDEAPKRLLGLVALAAANYGEPDYMKALQRLSFSAEAHLITEGRTFEELVHEKRKRLEPETDWDPEVPF